MSSFINLVLKKITRNTKLADMLEIYERFISKLIVLLMYILIIDVSIQILGRYIWFIPHLLWTIELANFLLIWIVFLGSIIGVTKGAHFFVDLFSRRALSPVAAKFLKIVYYTVMFVVSFVFIFFGYKFFLFGCKQGSMILDVNLGLIHIVVPITGISWFAYLLEDLYTTFFKARKNR